MSNLGEQIRVQERTARHLATEMEGDTTTLRHRVESTEWRSGAGDAFRSVLAEFLDDLAAAHEEVENLATDLGRHASTVEAHEKVLTDALSWPVDQVREGAEFLADSVHAGYSAVGRSWLGLTHVGGGH